MTLEHSTCARMPSGGLASLAGLRRSEGISIRLDGDSAWVIWEPGDDRVLRAVLPVEGVELFERRGDAWHRAGRRLPSFEGPPVSEPVPLARAVVPGPFSAEPPDDGPLDGVTLRLRRDHRPRPTSAATCPLAELARWADSATSAEIAAIRGAIQGDSALLLGPKLPAWPGSSRYWGGQVLVPVGFEVRPALPESAILEAIGDPTRDLLRLLLDGPGDEVGLLAEAVPLEVLRPLTRAGIRLAMAREGGRA